MNEPAQRRWYQDVLIGVLVVLIGTALWEYRAQLWAGFQAIARGHGKQESLESMGAGTTSPPTVVGTTTPSGSASGAKSTVAPGQVSTVRNEKEIESGRDGGSSGDGSDGGLDHGDDVYVDASLISSPPPRYPSEARRRNIEGTSVVLVSLNETGQVKKVSLETSSGNAGLDQAAIDAAWGWRFNPETKNGKGVPRVVRVPVAFNLE